MELFVFSSKNLTNIWAGIGARLWAVAKSDVASFSAGRKTKSQNMRVGSFGILYCVETKSLTTPFIVYFKPSVSDTINNVWPEEWILPFKMLPLGTPNQQLSIDDAKNILPILAQAANKNWTQVFHVQATTAFSASVVGQNDWEILVGRLAVE